MPSDASGPRAETPAAELFAALGDAGLHLMQPPFDLARALAGCTDPAQAMAASLRWSATRMDQVLADQARLMAAVLALAAPHDQARADAAATPPA
jgi:hypothetical protein